MNTQGRNGPSRGLGHRKPAPLRGIEAALEVWREVRRGRFASEVLRRVSDRVSEKDRPLAATLAYSVLRRESLWKELVGRFLKTGSSGVSPAVRDALVVGAAGALELRTFEPRVLVNALVEWTKVRDERGARVVNAVLRRVVADGPAALRAIETSGAFPDLALRTGTPLWAARSWEHSFGRNEGRELMELQATPVSLALRVSPGVDREAVVAELGQAGVHAWASPDMACSVRLEGTALPTALPGFDDGRISPQSEASMTAPLAFLKGGPGVSILDMCAGRGGKAGQMAQMCPDATVEGWDLSSGRIRAAEREMERLGVASRTTFVVGDAVELSPSRKPDWVSLDAPCSGSGTWRRHPEGKWRLTQKDLGGYAAIQVRLLRRALDMISPGGQVLYSTCSLFREENEQVVAAVMADRRSVVELEPPHDVIARCRRGRPWGHYIWPETPWSDGFYLALLTVTDEGGQNRP